MKSGGGVATLREVLDTLSKLLAPFTPFLAEALHQDLGGKASVHLEEWPQVKKEYLDDALLVEMEKTRQIVTQALEQREQTGMNIRQVLAGMTVYAKDDLSAELVEILKEEVNVKSVTIVAPAEPKVDLDTTLTPELKREGLVREIVRAGNAARKEAGLTIEDRIVLTVVTMDEQVRLALDEHRALVLEGTRADEVAVESGAGEPFRIKIQKV